MNAFRYILCLIFIAFLFEAIPPVNSNARLAADQRNSNTVNACPEIVYNNDMITESNCGNSDGSITGIQVTSSGTKIFYTWRDGNNKVVGNKLDLVNIPAGNYTLEVSDNSGCNQSVYSNTISIIDQNVVINANNVKIKPSGCNNDGAITGIIVTNATQYVWHIFNTQKDIITSTPDLVNIAPGTYKLTATNDKGCSIQSLSYTVSSNAPLPAIASITVTNLTCIAPEGSIAVTLNVAPTNPIEPFFFTDSIGNPLINGQIFPTSLNPTIYLNGITKGGTYRLYITGPDQCNYLLQSFYVKPLLLTIPVDSSMVYNDKCNQHIGGIEPIFDGGPPTPVVTTYTWTDASGKVIGHLKFINNLGAGIYTLKVFDPASGCFAVATFTIINTSPALVPPVADNINLCLPATAGIAVKNIDTSGYYRLYANLTDSIPIATSKPGIFFEPVKETTDYYIAFKKADCESARTKVTVTVFADLTIPNAFTPNNDGINDYWNIAGIEKFPGADVSLFSRGGQLIFHSIGYGVPFDGRINGKELPVGVYYYIIDVHQSICVGKISGSLTLIR